MLIRRSRIVVPERKPLILRRKLFSAPRTYVDGRILGENGARMSGCGLHRFLLWRTWGDGPRLPFIMLNPSTADASVDDPTIRRCIGFARKYETYGGIFIANLFSLRATDPNELILSREDACPQGNLDALLEVVDYALIKNVPIVCGWGANVEKMRARAYPPLSLLSRNPASYTALKVTNRGHPGHPLYLPGRLQLSSFSVWTYAEDLNSLYPDLDSSIPITDYVHRG